MRSGRSWIELGAARIRREYGRISEGSVAIRRSVHGSVGRVGVLRRPLPLAECRDCDGRASGSHTTPQSSSATPRGAASPYDPAHARPPKSTWIRHQSRQVTRPLTDRRPRCCRARTRRAPPRSGFATEPSDRRRRRSATPGIGLRAPQPPPREQHEPHVQRELPALSGNRPGRGDTPGLRIGPQPWPLRLALRARLRDDGCVLHVTGGTFGLDTDAMEITRSLQPASAHTNYTPNARLPQVDNARDPVARRRRDGRGPRPGPPWPMK
jgi:hypothetical protein